MMQVRFFVISMTIIVSMLSAVSQAQSEIPDGFILAVAEDGAIRLPDLDYRKDWVQLGTWSVAATDSTGAGVLHVVYTQPQAVWAVIPRQSRPTGSIFRDTRC